uniref:Uncharacterized protein n=1 Tax=Alphatorquevirus sp. TaxID=2809145 RepID=A0A8K1XHL3_9VIRU|nr:MAG: hypothetical protein [Alphatorquevirus sp.]
MVRIDNGNRDRSRSPRRRDANGPAAAQPAAPRTKKTGEGDQQHLQTAHKDPATPPRPHYPLVGGPKYLFPERLPKPYTTQDWETEYQCCKAWDRPPRNNLSDPPFYPWMPRDQYRVTFKLGFQ